MSDQDLILDALETAEHILAEYIRPGAPRWPEHTIRQLQSVLDRQDLAAARERLKAGYGLRVVK
jgi:hypothetical protein